MTSIRLTNRLCQKIETEQQQNVAHKIAGIK